MIDSAAPFLADFWVDATRKGAAVRGIFGRAAYIAEPEAE